MTEARNLTAYREVKARLDELTARDLLDLLRDTWKVAQQQAKSAPAMTHARDEDECPALRCPHCDDTLAGVHDVDLSIRCTVADRMDDRPGGGYALQADYERSDYEGSVLMCFGCEAVVSLPRDVSVAAI